MNVTAAPKIILLPAPLFDAPVYSASAEAKFAATVQPGATIMASSLLDHLFSAGTNLF
jgi:hypothetical protein